MNRVVAIAALVFLVLTGLNAQTIETEEDSLFGTAGTEEAEGDLFLDGALVTDVEETEEDLGALLLSSEGVDIGGQFRFTVASDWRFDGPGGPFGADLDESSQTIDLGARIFMDGRPTESFRVFGKLDLSYPFGDEGGTRDFDEVFHVVELFSDFQMADSVFFRAGKQTINWGVGYFFSPADLLNVTEIDPEDPEAELEGPVALKTHMPLGNHNLYLYIVPEDADRIEKTSLAPKVELLIGNTEIGVGAFYRLDLAPAAMATLTRSFLDLNIFAEGVLSYGSNRIFVVEDAAAPSGVVTETVTDRLFPSGTFGFSYLWSDDLDNYNFSVSVQYLYNGEGYGDPEILSGNTVAIKQLLTAGDITAADLMNTGTHYAAARGSWNSLFTSDISLGCFWIGNLADGSGSVAPFIKWEVLDEMDITFTSTFKYGERGDEFTPAGDTLALTVSVNAGGGRF